MEQHTCISAYAKRVHEMSFLEALSSRSILHTQSLMDGQVKEVSPHFQLNHYLARSFVGLAGIALYEQVRRVLSFMPSTNDVVGKLIATGACDDSDPSPPERVPVPVPIPKR
ncbi:hypothetical protein JW766_03330 [Candidatus Dojkabacteria bacterium]|nr:hypothetical protein [Candidatus Dojkabacteria bacterium]